MSTDTRHVYQPDPALPAGYRTGVPCAHCGLPRHNRNVHKRATAQTHRTKRETRRQLAQQAHRAWIGDRDD